MMGQPVVYLNSAEAVTELFSKRGNIYSDRPQTTMAVEMYVLSAIQTLTRISANFCKVRAGRHCTADEIWRPI